MKITVRELKNVIGQAVAEARAAKSKKGDKGKGAKDKKQLNGGAQKRGKKTVKEGAEHAEIAGAIDDLLDMPGWDSVPNGESLKATLEKINARLHASASSAE